MTYIITSHRGAIFWLHTDFSQQAMLYNMNLITVGLTLSVSCADYTIKLKLKGSL